MAEQKLPNFFVVGAAKAGTTSIYNYLAQHPQVYMSPVKEPHHFATDMDSQPFRDNYDKVMNKDLTDYLEGDMKELVFQSYIREWSQYVKLFKNVKDEKAIGEASNSYLHSSTSAENIHSKIPGAKVIMILRNPISRAFSHYVMDIRIGYAEASFMQALKKDIALPVKGWGVSNLYVELGLYYEQVKRYINLFPPEQLHIVLFDDFKKNTPGEMKEIFSFIGVNENEAINYNETYNEAALPRNKLIGSLYQNKKLNERIKKLIPTALKRRLKKVILTSNALPVITDDERSFLRTIFHDDVVNLSKLLNRDLSFWLK